MCVHMDVVYIVIFIQFYVYIVIFIQFSGYIRLFVEFPWLWLA